MILYSKLYYIILGESEVFISSKMIKLIPKICRYYYKMNPIRFQSLPSPLAPLSSLPSPPQPLSRPSSPFATAVKPNEIGHFDYCFLILGETGVGKSTFVNTIVNAVLETSVENLKVAIRCEKYPILNPEFDDNIFERMDSVNGSSQTKYAHYYKLSGSLTNYKTFLFVDTPGIASTDGVQDDEENFNEIIKAARLIKKFNAILFVQQQSATRTTQRFNYYISILSEIIPIDFERSVIRILTFSTQKKAY